MKEILKFNLKKDQPLSDAIKVVNSRIHGFAIVMSNKFELLGTITDGDIRRAILKFKSLNLKVSDIMNSDPIVAKDKDNLQFLNKLMFKNKINFIPILKNGIVLRIELTKKSKSVQLDNPVLIMAGGFGSRLMPLTASTPKPLLCIKDKPILSIIIEQLITSGFRNFFISTHYKGNKIKDVLRDGKDYGINITYIDEITPLGTAGALSFMPDTNNDLPILLMNADILTKLDFKELLEFHSKNKAKITVCIKDYLHKIPYGVAELNAENLIKLEEKPSIRRFINAGIYLISNDIKKNLDDGFKNITDIINSEIKKKSSVVAFPIHEYWMDIGKIEDYMQAQKDFE